MGMKFMIAGSDTVYDAEAGVEKASLGLLYELKVKTGIGVKQLARMVQSLNKYSDPMDILDDKDGFRALMIVIWLARRHAGEKLSIEQANDVPIMDLMLIGEEEQQQEEQPDPKATSPASAVENGNPPATDSQAA